MHLVQAKRQPTVAPHEAEEDREAFLKAVEVKEEFEAPVPRVFKEHRVTLKGEPLDALTIEPVAPRRWL